MKIGIRDSVLYAKQFRYDSDLRKALALAINATFEAYYGTHLGSYKSSSCESV